MDRVFAVIVAAGAGKRMGGAVPKQYLALKDRPILRLTLAAVRACERINRIFLVVPEKDFDFCRREVLAGMPSREDMQLVAGGSTRQESVYNGLSAVNDPHGVVVIHDGVRPFVRAEQIEACIDQTAEHGACVLGIPAHDTLKKVSRTGIIEETIARDAVWLSQTPQAFRYSLIKKAHEEARKSGYSGSDDAVLVERLGLTVRIITGSRYNIKITTKEDLLLAGALVGAGLV